ncbi:MarR family winged helix-turn-helix transcriptional regulator [Lysobacter sp. H23M47]|uniref:MarR family winged helix-turn-helix transcriptional regulator n=1 Tax=Lysobacter sp. H23M47 TaxID=2781024 RepID=UPI0018824315|nr:MarR family winged helix-turn-helix transcriptional regulator [Lysobacter sp. H23M47]QOW24858.1 winged helix-turn-helix transcriptional regulator [Lysobacter sp. H23M47]
MNSEPPGPAQLELERFLPYRLSVLSNRLSAAIARLYAERFSLGMTEWRVMAVLGRYPDLSASEVTGRTAMDKVAVSRAVARLIEAGWLERSLHAEDRRRSVLRLSAAGHAVYDEVAPMALEFEQRLFGDIDPAQLTRLFDLLDRLDALDIEADAEHEADADSEPASGRASGVTK